MAVRSTGFVFHAGPTSSSVRAADSSGSVQPTMRPSRPEVSLETSVGTAEVRFEIMEAIVILISGHAEVLNFPKVAKKPK